MRAAELLQSGFVCAILAMASGPAAAQSLLTYPGGISTMPPSAAPQVAPPVPQTAPAPVPSAAPVAAAPQAAPQAAAPVSSCDADMMKLQQKRNGTMEQVNSAVKPDKKGRIDPNVACPRLKSLVSVETEMKTWMTKNQDWCNIPDQVMEDMKAGFSKTAEVADRACTAAAQMKRAQQQQARSGGLGGPAQAPAPKLPSGPL